jgi:hypothetical protein
MIDRDVMLLQDRKNSEMGVWNDCGETNPTSGDVSEVISIKVEEVSDAEDEEGPVPITFPKMKTEPEVRCMSLYVNCKK